MLLKKYYYIRLSGRIAFNHTYYANMYFWVIGDGKVMSLPAIPDISREQALTHILESIALEEAALAAFINVEAKKTQIIVEKINEAEKEKMPTHAEIIAFQKSVDSTIQTVIKMQMLLQFNLKAVLDAKSKPIEPSPASSSRKEFVPGEIIQNDKFATSQQQEESTQACNIESFLPQENDSQVSPATWAYDNKCSLSGQGQGRITNSKDSFFCGGASIQDILIHANHGVIESGLFLYQVVKKGIIVRLKIMPKTLKIQNKHPFCMEPLPENPNIAVITGKCIIEKQIPAESTVFDRGSFIFTVWDGGTGGPGTDKFRMIITADSKPAILNHDSGIVSVIGNLTIKTADSDNAG